MQIIFLFLLLICIMAKFNTDSKKPITMLQKDIIIWDNDGTIMGSKNPNDTSDNSKIILPNIENVMRSTRAINIICSGCKTPESELQNFDSENIIKKFTKLMNQLPIQVAVFSPAMGGKECYIIIKKINSENIKVIKAHEDIRYQEYIGHFKKPDIGMLIVIQDILKEEFNKIMIATNTVMIGDTWHDEHAAFKMNIPFLNAVQVHRVKF